ncbi:hypothetical protein Ade02nite_23380 [Paractinoplanes deccanensis]|uniref:Uncharacterized protein n=1 Tax=Paractinoplanes deccanensis TaxID=113561 RepID=A0ABQ3Y139_9ACTN|nr:hypothetical protein [Actinoplanes deccanensis]GID73697.1 hypothetical protein Ade02nite_23380 [Actinoplanes deccanensis]
MDLNLIDNTIVEPLPRLHDVVTSQGLEPFEQRPGVVIDIYRQPDHPAGDRYRVEYRDGSTEWYWASELTVLADAFSPADVIADLGSARIQLFEALTKAGQNDVLTARLSVLFDKLIATARTYLGADLGHGPDHISNSRLDDQDEPERHPAEGRPGVTVRPSTQPPPQSREVATTADGLAPYYEKRGVVIDVYLAPELPDGDRYRIEFRYGATLLNYNSTPITEPLPVDSQLAAYGLAAARTLLDFACASCRPEDVLQMKVSAVLDHLTYVAATHLPLNLNREER